MFKIYVLSYGGGNFEASVAEQELYMGEDGSVPIYILYNLLYQQTKKYKEFIDNYKYFDATIEGRYRFRYKRDRETAIAMFLDATTMIDYDDTKCKNIACIKREDLVKFCTNID